MPAQLWPLFPSLRSKMTAKPKPKPKPNAVPLPERVAVASTSLTVLAVLSVWLLAQILVLGGLEQNRAQDRLYSQFRTQLASSTAPTGGIIAPGAPVALLTIPSLGYEQVVAEGTSSGVMLSGPGHRRDTVLPGQAGVSLIYGRARTFGKPFGPMLSEAAGKTMTVVTSQGKTSYTIGRVRRAGEPMPVVPTADGSRITMATADGTGRLGALSPRNVVYIDATIVGKPFAAPAGRLNAIGPSETAMANDTSVMPALALSLGALAVMVAGTVFSRQRFGFVRTWVIATPIILSLAWLTADLAMYLLPNLL